MEPATKRGEPGLAYSSATRRAMRADASASSWARSVQLLDGLGLRDDEDLVAALEGFASEVVRVQFLELQVGARRAVEDEDPLGECREVGIVPAWAGEGWTGAGLH
jgi:hypothetical protein